MAQPQPYHRESIRAAPVKPDAEDKPTGGLMDAGVGADIQWNHVESLKIQLPPEDCNPDEMKVLCMQVCEVIRANKSVAVGIKGQIDISRPLDAIEVARETFTPLERQMYEEWENGVSLDDWDFDANDGDGALSGRKAKRFAKMALALDALYEREDTTPEEARAWAIGNQALMPLCIAQTKILRAESDAEAWHPDIDRRLLREKWALTRIVAVIGRRRNEWGKRWPILNRLMSETERLIQARLVAIGNSYASGTAGGSM